MSQKEWPANPNRMNAVGATLPALTSVLMGFLGAYFASATLSDYAYLAKPLIFEVFGYQLYELGLTRKLAISIATALGLTVVLVSLLSSVATTMLDWESSGQDYSEAPQVITDGWNKDRLKHARTALICFHFTLPMIGLSLVLLTDGTVLTFGCAGVLIWLLYQVVQLIGEIRK